MVEARRLVARVGPRGRGAWGRGAEAHGLDARGLVARVGPTRAGWPRAWDRGSEVRGAEGPRRAGWLAARVGPRCQGAWGRAARVGPRGRDQPQKSLLLVQVGCSGATKDKANVSSFRALLLVPICYGK